METSNADNNALKLPNKILALLKKPWLSLILLTCVCLALLVFCGNPSQQKFERYSFDDGYQLLPQNLSKDQIQQLTYTSFGSRLMPLRWFLALEVPDSTQLLREQLAALGFIPLAKAENNPHGLPAGFATDYDSHNDFNYGSDKEAWVGLSCAACHSSQISFAGETLFIPGGPGLIEFQGFEELVLASLEALLRDPVKFLRFADNLKIKNDEARSQLKANIESRTQFFRSRSVANNVEVPYGHGRLDAFGQIFNSVAATALGIEKNARPANAPVSIPMLWDASHQDLVQWNGSAPNREPGPLGQNATTALAVYGTIDLKQPSILGYHSSVRIRNLGYIQSTYHKLHSPEWPETLLGKIDAAQAKKGKVIYERHCSACHALIDRTAEQKSIRVKLVPQETLGTDPLMAKNFVESLSETGVLKGKKSSLFFGIPFEQSSPTINIVMNAAIGALFYHPIDTLGAVLFEKESIPKASPNLTKMAYKARPLNGIWASAPYLHNGSVPSLKDLLRPEDERPKNFYLGNAQYDPINVGFSQLEHEKSSLFDTELPGNSNKGHHFGTEIDEAEKAALLEFMKQL